MSGDILLIRCDASSVIGTGHVMRMLAIAQAWKRRGGHSVFACLTIPPPLQQRLSQLGVRVEVFADLNQQHQTAISTERKSMNRFPSAGSIEDARWTAKRAIQHKAKVVLADGYQFGSQFQLALKDAGLRLAIATDYDYCDCWECDWVLNQNPHATHESYHSEHDGFQRLLGLRYALLREEFLSKKLVPVVRAESDPVQLLITLGGSDAGNVTGALLSRIESSSAVLKIRVLIGAANTHRSSLERDAMTSRHAITLLSNVDDMPAQYAWADAIISAGGSSCWEWMYCGIPGAVVAIADNQLPIYKWIIDQKVAVGLGHAIAGTDTINQVNLDGFIARARSHLSDPERYRSWVDGYGAERVASCLDSGVWLRPVGDADRELLFDWANEPLVRMNSLNAELISWPDHCDWFAMQLKNKEAKIWIAIHQERPVGQVRFKRLESGHWEVSFLVAPEARGAGLGREILRLGIQRMVEVGCNLFAATVKKNNPASARCFHQLGWVEVGSDHPTLLRFHFDASVESKFRSAG